MSLTPHPEPPSDLSSRSLPLETTDRLWFRTHQLNLTPIFFGNTGDHRFNAPGGEYGVMYCGQDEHCAFIETFGHETGNRVIDEDTLSKRGLARITCPRPLRLVKLFGDGLAHLSADARLATGDYTLAQRWALALNNHPDTPDGIMYISRHDDQRLCAALFHRIAKEINAEKLGAWADKTNAKLLAQILDTYDFGLIK
jgi:hypothetical protein